MNKVSQMKGYRYALSLKGTGEKPDDNGQVLSLVVGGEDNRILVTR